MIAVNGSQKAPRPKPYSPQSGFVVPALLLWRTDPFILHQRQHAIVYEGIERHLLEQAKGEVGVSAMPENHMGQQALRSAQCQAADSQAREDCSENKQACFVAGQRLSARQPSVFGVSRWMKKLTINHTTNTIQVHRAVNCRRQIYQRMNAGRSVTSAGENHR